MHSSSILRRFGPTEAIDNLIKGVAFGFRRFAHCPIRALLCAGKPHWDLLATVTHD